MIKRILLLAVLFTALFSVTAQAQTPIPGSTPANNPYAEALRDEAVKFWAERGVAAPRAWVYLIDCNGCEYSPPGGIVYMDRRYLRWATRWPSDRRANEDECYKMFHGIGHQAGLAHTPTGVMSQWGGPRNGADGYMPFRCRQIARDRAAGIYPY